MQVLVTSLIGSSYTLLYTTMYIVHVMYNPQILCSRGYSDQLAGLSAAAIIVAGFLASFPIGYLAVNTGKLISVAKVILSSINII